MLNSLFSSGKPKQTVGIALTPGIGLEAIIIDKHSGTVVNYGVKKVEYNFKTRAIDDYVAFKTALNELMDEMKIAPKTNAYLILPNVYFNFAEVPLSSPESEIKTILLSNTEEFYLFKKDEPVSGWCEVPNPESGNTRKIAYTSFQKSVIDEISDVFADSGLKLIGVESSYSATLRGLYSIGMIGDSDLISATWTVMLINTNSFTLFNLEGKTLLEYNEVPLAIKSFSTEEAYGAIVSSASQLLSNYDSSKLFIISQTDDICAEALKKQMQFDREIVAIDSNKFSKKPLMEVLSALDFNDANSLTLAAIGAVDYKSNFGMTLNVFAEIAAASSGVYFTTMIGGNPVDITQEVVQKIAMLVFVVALAVFGGANWFLYNTNMKNESAIDDYNREIKKLDTLIAAESKVEEVVEVVEEVDMNAIIDEIAESNVNAIKYYDSIATDIPKNVWLIKYYNKSGNQVAVRGIAENIVDIYEYYKNLRIVSPQTDIRLNELRVVTHDEESEEENRYLHNLVIDKDADRLYRFEISNTSIPVVDEKSEKKVDETDVLSSPPRQNIEDPSGQMEPME